MINFRAIVSRVFGDITTGCDDKGVRGVRLSDDREEVVDCNVRRRGVDGSSSSTTDVLVWMVSTSIVSAISRERFDLSQLVSLFAKAMVMVCLSRSQKISNS